MSNQLKQYEKGGRLVRFLGWLTLVATIGAILSTLIPAILKSEMTPQLASGIPYYIFLIIYTVFQLFLGNAIKAHLSWSRIVGIIFGIILLIGFPIGTIAGVYLIICLTKGWNTAK